MTEPTGVGANGIDKDLYSAVVGAGKAAYYLPKFERFAKGGRLASWNWSAFFISFYWLLYRKMWLWAAVYFFLPYLLFFVLAIVAIVTTPWVLKLFLPLYLLINWVVVPIYANALYYRQVRKKVQLAANTFSTSDKAANYLSINGGPSIVVGVIVGVLFSIPVIGILAAIAIPQYQDYVQRANVAAAYQHALPVKEKITGYYQAHQEMPESLATAGVKSQMLSDDASISYVSDTLLIRFTANSVLQDKTFYLTPTVYSGEIQWSCGSNTIQQNWLPEGCASYKGNPPEKR